MYVCVSTDISTALEKTAPSFILMQRILAMEIIKHKFIKQFAPCKHKVS